MAVASCLALSLWQYLGCGCAPCQNAVEIGTCRQQQQHMPPEPGDCHVVRLSSFGKPRGSWDQHQEEDSLPVRRGRSAEAADMEAAMALAVRATHFDNRGSHSSAAAVADHSDESSMDQGATASLRCGNSAPHLQLPVHQPSHAAGANVHPTIFEGQGQSRHLPAIPISPARSVSGGYLSNTVWSRGKPQQSQLITFNWCGLWICDLTHIRVMSVLEVERHVSPVFPALSCRSLWSA